MRADDTAVSGLDWESGSVSEIRNLCDDMWKNVYQIEDVTKMVANGAAGKAMPAWGARLHPNELVLVSCYVASLRGTSPPGPVRPPEGKAIPPWKP